MKEIIRAAFVIGRRDFTAIIYSKAFIFFLLGPLFPVLVGVAAGNVSGQIAKETNNPVVGLALSQGDSEKILNTRDILSKNLGKTYFTDMKVITAEAQEGVRDPQTYLKNKADNLSVIVTGSLASPVITGTEQAISREKADIELLVGHALNPGAVKLPKIASNIVGKTANNDKQLRIATGQAGQMLIFILTILLAGMVLSNLVEEKSNKIIEILAASIPMESVFVGKLFAMLGMALVGVVIWASLGFIAIQIWQPALPTFPEPAVGWPIFITLGVAYFTLAYLMLGALFLGIGAMAATVREVQTISMPVTMVQIINFFFAAYSITKINQPIEQIACIFPFSSPFAMLGRAAQEPNLWHHGVAIAGQIAFATLLLKLGVVLFKRNVMKSGNSGKVKGDGKRRLFGLIPMQGATSN